MSIKLLCAPTMEEMGSDIVRLGRGVIEMIDVKWKRFKDGWPNTKVPEYESLRHQDVVFIASWDEMADTLEQFMFIATITRMFKVRSLKIILPYYPTGMKDRWEEEGEVITGYELAQMMEFIPTAKSGPVDLVIYDIHALQEERYFPKNIRVERRSMMPAFRHELQLMGESCAVAMPDEGAYKRYKNIFVGMDKIICEKRRVPGSDDKIITIKEGDPNGKHVWIIDDIGMTCGTLINTKTALMAAGALSVSCFFVHGVLPQNAAATLVEAGFENNLTTNSNRNSRKLVGTRGSKILSMAEDISQDILEDYRPVTPTLI